jgi:hypothetical protein
MRPKYDDTIERDLILFSHSNVNTRIFAAALWKEVIEKAIQDIVLGIIKIDNDQLEEEDKEILLSANSFLFSDSHYIFYDDYIVQFVCSVCKTKHNIYMSAFASEKFTCCNKKYTPETTEYEVVKIIKEITLQDLLSQLQEFNLSYWREEKRKEIGRQLKKKKEYLRRRSLNEPKRTS